MEGSTKSKELPPLGRQMRSEFFMTPKFIPLNHGCYGTFPNHVKAALYHSQDRVEENGDRWLRIDLLKELTHVRQQLATYLNADDPDDLALVQNTTAGMNAIFRSIKFQSGDKILHFSTVYEAVRSLIQFVLDSNKNVGTLEFVVNYPISNQDLVRNFSAFLDENYKEDSQIRIAIIDHVSSIPGVVNPVEEFISLLKERNIRIIVDGAHATGQAPVDLKALDVDYYITNCHKWLYAARGTGVMYVKKIHQEFIHPTAISSNYACKANFQKEFFWTGATNSSVYMTIPAAIEFRAQIGEEKLRFYMHKLAIQGGQLVASCLGTTVLQTEDQIGNMVDVELPLRDPQLLDEISIVKYMKFLLLKKFNMAATMYKHNGKIWARLCAQIYTDLSDFEKAAEVFKIICKEINENGEIVNGNP